MLHILHCPLSGSDPSSALLGLVSLIFVLTIPHKLFLGFRQGRGKVFYAGGAVGGGGGGVVNFCV